MDDTLAEAKESERYWAASVRHWRALMVEYPPFQSYLEIAELSLDKAQKRIAELEEKS